MIVEANIHRMKLKMLKEQQNEVIAELKHLLPQLHSPSVMVHTEHHKKLRKQKILLWQRFSRYVRREEKLWGELVLKK